MIDDISGVGEMQITSDYFFRENVVTLPYTNTVSWGFADSSAVYVRLVDEVGNVSERLNAVLQEEVVPTVVDLNQASSGQRSSTLPHIFSAIAIITFVALILRRTSS